MDRSQERGFASVDKGAPSWDAPILQKTGHHLFPHLTQTGAHGPISFYWEYASCVERREGRWKFVETKEEATNKSWNKTGRLAGYRNTPESHESFLTDPT
jgi:hypothetical protein